MKPFSQIQIGRFLNNGHFHFTPHHEFAKKVLEYFRDTYDPDSPLMVHIYGPVASGTVFKEMYKMPEVINGVFELGQGNV